jgi:hypothetical protein
MSHYLEHNPDPAVELDAARASSRVRLTPASSERSSAFDPHP